MIIENFAQLSDEWFAARAGIPSASNFDKIVTTKGEPSKQAQKYMYQLAGERLLGAKEGSYTNAAMQRGIELEPEARRLYEMITGNAVAEVGLCYRDEDKRFSCSPDGIVVDGGLEIKCPSLAVHVEYLEGGGLPSTYYQQVQGSLYVTGLEWWDFLSYYPGIRPLLIRVTPDKKFHDSLHDSLGRFCDALDELSMRLAA